MLYERDHLPHVDHHFPLAASLAVHLHEDGFDGAIILERGDDSRCHLVVDDVRAAWQQQRIQETAILRADVLPIFARIVLWKAL